MSQHHDAIVAFQEGRAAEALALLEELLAASETSELWNDWAAVQLGLGQISQAESGFTRALELDSENTDATANLGLLLLGRGDSGRATPLLERALPALPAAQQKVVRALLTGLTVPQPSPNDKRPSAGRILRVLVIAEVFPNPITDGRELRLLQILSAWRQQGDEVTFIAREAGNRRQCEPLLHQAGIHTYGNDSERLPTLGEETGAPSWCFRELVEDCRFDIAILVQSFSSGISIPEHYLDDLRRYSPATRIVVFADQLHIPSHGNKETALLDFEREEDYATRQWETFDRADAVLVSTEDYAISLRESVRNLHVEVATDYLTLAGIANTRERIISLTPKSLAKEGYSVMEIETLFHQRLSVGSDEDRILRSLECYVRLADQLLADGNPMKARTQLRHIFGRAPGLLRGGHFAAQVFVVLKRCYRSLGDTERAERCAAEARRCAVVHTPAVSLVRHGQRNGRLFSVIVPTYNRLPILKKCLAALEAQTLPSANFEVIVIDDGSSDATQELLGQYRPHFPFQYLHQRNSGTGAARRNGVAHADGEYLLLMNDDTICAPDLLERHLQAQQKYAPERWAVLGHFEYPAAAKQRALTRYFCVEPFMFPQVSLEEGCPYGYSHFITCNLSIRRDAVVEAGSFDSTYKLSEDTELGIRLHERGYRVLYHPDAYAIHDHLPYPARNLIRRARVYGADYFYMFGRHPRVMKEWAMPVDLTAMDEENALRILSYVEEHRRPVEQAIEALERWDSVDFELLLADQPDTASMVLRLFQQAVPAIHWFYLFETMLQTMIRELGLKHVTSEPLVMPATQAAGV
jgi:glycosyltransferase involved in cell wall biosynthesis/tetratricopeptide (TPR) repeat protein